MSLRPILFSCMLFAAFSSFGQEICDNGIDDDGDGWIDSEDTEDCSCTIPVYFIPNSFSPDGDERNNVFLPVFSCGFDPSSYQLQVYNRRGDLLFTSFDSQLGWDGCCNGWPSQTGTYSWEIRFSTLQGESKFLSGHVNLFR